MVSIMQDDTLYHEKHINDPGSCWIARINDDDDVNDGNDDDSDPDDSNDDDDTDNDGNDDDDNDDDDSDDDDSNDDDDSDDDGYNDDDDVDDDDNSLLTANLLKGESVDDGYRKRPPPLPRLVFPDSPKNVFLDCQVFHLSAEWTRFKID